MGKGGPWYLTIPLHTCQKAGRRQRSGNGGAENYYYNAIEHADTDMWLHKCTQTFTTVQFMKASANGMV